MLRIVLLISGVISFLYFLNPDVFPNGPQFEKTLGVNTINQVANAQVVRQALTIHCINHQKLPSNLNQLYDDELSSEKYVDLDAMFNFIPKADCEFDLNAKS